MKKATRAGPPNRKGHAMLAGSGGHYENAYLETTIWADLDLDPPA